MLLHIMGGGWDSHSENIENLPIFAQSSVKVETSGIVQTTLEVPIDSSVIFEAKLFTINTETKEESQDPLYYGKTEVINIKKTDTKVSIVLIKIQKVQFNSLGGSSVNIQKVDKNKTATTPTEPTKSGYTFDGWYTSSDDGKTLQAKFDFSTPITSDITLYAKWNIVDYTIMYEFNGGEAVDNPTSYNIETETISLASPTKTGYTFDGWYTDSNFSTDKKVTEITKGSTGAVTLYAKWIANKSGITITLPESNDPEINLQQEMNGEKVTFTAKGGFASYAWYIDGEIQANATESTFIVDTSSMEAANYKVMIIVTDSDGNYYSATADLELKK